MRKLIAAVASITAIAALAVPALASATVNVNDQGIGSIDKGDVQSPFGYNDAAFQAAQASGKITFSLGSDVTNVFADTKCAAGYVLQPGDPFEATHVPLGSLVTPRTPNVTPTKNPQGKVTGYTATGITTGAQTGSVNYGLSTKCPAGENFFGWLDSAHPFHSETTPGSSVLQVSNGVKTVALPNTPVL
jgi:hypothetical protein